MATMVLDAHALMILFNDEPGAEEVEKILLKAESGTPRLLMSVINWGEIYYSIMRGASQEMADSKAHEIAGMRIELVPVDARDLELIRQAAIFKATKKMSVRRLLRGSVSKDEERRIDHWRLRIQSR